MFIKPLLSRRSAFRLAFGAALAPAAFAAAPARAQSFGRITSPAQKLTAEGLRNFYEVDTGVYRAHQPENREQFASLLKSYRIRTIVNLRDDSDDSAYNPDPRIRLVRTPLDTFNLKGGEAQIARALAAIRQGRERGSVLFHCEFGKDRTGAVAALYHMMFQGWSRERALTDMIAGPFKFHEFFTLFPPGHSIHGYVANVDATAMKRRVLAMGRV